MSKSKKNKKRNEVNHTDNKNKFNRKKAITVTGCSACNCRSGSSFDFYNA